MTKPTIYLDTEYTLMVRQDHHQMKEMIYLRKLFSNSLTYSVANLMLI